jgi:hypothetical protein
MPTHAPLEQFRRQSRDLYIAGGDIGMWQGALRNPDDPNRAAIAEAIDAQESITIELLYSDQIGLQRTITRFALIPAKDSWFTSMSRHWYLDWDGPRPEADVNLATATLIEDREAAERHAAAQSATTNAASDAGVAGEGSQ